MAVVSSKQVAVKPFRIDTRASLADIAAMMQESAYLPLDEMCRSGWGSLSDTDTVLGQSPDLEFEVGIARPDGGEFRTPGTLAGRYYWWTVNAAAERRLGTASTTPRTRRLSAADVLFFPSADVGFSGLVTARESTQFEETIQGMQRLFDERGIAASISTDALPEMIPEDLFLWLLSRLQGNAELTSNCYLGGVREISSRDRMLRGARFQDEASVERIELAALVAIGADGFGPAKFNLLTVNPDAGFHLELHADGGFQPYRSSYYERRPDIDGARQALALIEDLWMVVLPELREAYGADVAWANGGRLLLRQLGYDTAITLLGSRPV